MVRGGLKDGDLDPVISEYEEYIDKRARELKAEGKLSRLYEEEPFGRHGLVRPLPLGFQAQMGTGFFKGDFYPPAHDDPVKDLDRGYLQVRTFTTVHFLLAV